MLDFTVRFILASLKLIFKVTLIIGGLVCSSLASAAFAMLSSSDSDNEQKSEDFNKNGFVYDKNSAMQAFSAGEIDEFELAHYCAMSDSDK